MKKIVAIALVAGCMYGSLNAANFDIGISGSDRGINGFSLSIGDYYRVPAQEIIMIERSIPYEETSVVYFLAQHSHKSPRYISNLRLRGMSWWDISLHLGLDPRTLYVVDSRRYSGPPFGKAYGYQNEGRHHRLNDADIVELVNVRFLSTYHGISVDDVIERRNRGQQYMNIDDDYRMKKYNHQLQQQIQNREHQKFQPQNMNRENQKFQQQNKHREQQNTQQKSRNKQDRDNYKDDRR